MGINLFKCFGGYSFSFFFFGVRMLQVSFYASRSVSEFDSAFLFIY